MNFLLSFLFAESRGEQRKELKLKVDHNPKQRPSFISRLRQFFHKRKGKTASAGKFNLFNIRVPRMKHDVVEGLK